MASVAEGLNPVLRLSGLRHRLSDRARNEHYTVYVDQCLEFYSRDFIGLLGPSGCGKTTLLTVLGLLRSPTNLDDLSEFELFVPEEVSRDDSWQRIDMREAWQKRKYRLIEKMRRRHIGFALQSGELISSLTVQENIGMPLKLNGAGETEVASRTKELMSQFKLTRLRDSESEGNSTQEQDSDVGNALADSRINRLSGGEYQRVALARSIAHRPSVVFVDEPTSALNRELAHGALSVMRDLQRNRERAGITFMITHDEDLAQEFCNVVVRMAPRRNEPAGEVVEVTRCEIDTEVGSNE